MGTSKAALGGRSHHQQTLKNNLVTNANIHQQFTINAGHMTSGGQRTGDCPRSHLHR